MSDKPIRKIRLVSSSKRRMKAVKLTPPSAPILYVIGQPMCPECCQVLCFTWQNIDHESHTVLVEHGNSEYMTCPNRGKKFRFKIPSVEVTEV